MLCPVDIDHQTNPTAAFCLFPQFVPIFFAAADPGSRKHECARSVDVTKSRPALLSEIAAGIVSGLQSKVDSLWW
jgi:hypothetical protein